MAKRGRPKKQASNSTDTANSQQTSHLWSFKETQNRLWTMVEPHVWESILREADPAGKWVLKGDSLEGKCPWHDDIDPSLKMSFKKRFGKCFGCGHFFTDLISLLEKIMRKSRNEIMVWLSSRITDFDKIIGQDSTEFAMFNELQEMKKQAAVAFSKVIEEYIRDKPTYLSYLEPGFVYLTNGRLLNAGNIPAMPVALFAKPEHAKKYIDSKYHEAYDKYFGSYQDRTMVGAPIFHYNDTTGSISRFKLRKFEYDGLDRYRAIKEAHRDTPDNLKGIMSKVFIELKDPYYQKTGLFGLHFYSRAIGYNDTVYITEGEFDALSFMSAQITADNHGIIMLATGGTGSLDVSFLKELGIKNIYMLQDKNDGNGDAFANAFLSTEANFKDDGNGVLTFRMFQWPDGISGKDLDDAIKHHGYEAILELISQDKDKNFISVTGWIESMCLAECKDIRARYDSLIQSISLAEKTEAEDNDIPAVHGYKAESDRLIKEAILRWMKKVNDPVERIQFTEDMAKLSGINLADIDELKKDVYSLNTTQGVINHLKSKLSEYLVMAYFIDSASQKIPQYIMWSRAKLSGTQLPNSKASMDQFIAQYTGVTIVKFIGQSLGSTAFITPKGGCEDPIFVMQQETENAKALIHHVFNEMIAGCPSKDELTVVGQGIHYYGVTSRDTVYVINGSKVFKGKFTGDDNRPVTWEFVNHMVDGKFLFNLNRGEKWSFIDTVDDLYSAEKVDLKKLFNDVKTILSAWKFKDDELIRTYLAAYILSIPVQAAIGQVNITYLNGEANSGKTSFLKGLLGGVHENSHEIVPLIECSKFSSDCTPAWMYQEMDRSSLLLCIDEAEFKQDGSTHSSRIQGIMDTIMSISMGGALIARGGTTQDDRSDYSLRMPVIMAGIKMNPDPTFLSRVMVLYTEKDSGRRACDELIRKYFTETELYEIQHKITVALIPHVQRLFEISNHLKESLPNVDAGVIVPGRFIGCIVQALTVYKFIDPENDVIGLYKKLVEYSKEKLTIVSDVNYRNDLIDAVLCTEAIKTMTTDKIANYVSARSLLLNADWNTVNNAEVGIYVIPEKKWLVFIWHVVKHSVLSKKSTDYYRMDTAAMKQSIAQNKFVVRDITMEDHEYIKSYLGISDINSLSEYSVVQLDYVNSIIPDSKPKEKSTEYTLQAPGYEGRLADVDGIFE